MSRDDFRNERASAELLAQCGELFRELCLEVATSRDANFARSAMMLSPALVEGDSAASILGSAYDITGEIASLVRRAKKDALEYMPADDIYTGRRNLCREKTLMYMNSVHRIRWVTDLLNKAVRLAERAVSEMEIVDAVATTAPQSLAG